MKKLTIDSYGKINLGLDVLYKRPDGYHEINTIMQQISLKDTITIEENMQVKDKLTIKSNNDKMPLDSTNLMYKAWDKLRKKTGPKNGIIISIDKKIPMAAGLAGGSSNAAGVLKALNDLWELDLSQEELMDIGVEIGADVACCIMGGTALAQGIGEKLTPLKSFGGKALLLVNPGIEVSSQYVYQNLKLKNGPTLDMDKIIKTMADDDIKALAGEIKNVMEKVVIKKHPIIQSIKDQMEDCGALVTLMSGSGPTVFGIFEDRDKLDICKDIFKDKVQGGIFIKAETI